MQQTIECACGCKTKLTPTDPYGRARQYISGHNGRKYSDPGQHKREWNHRNRKKRFKYKTEYGHKRKIKLIEQLGNQCAECHLRYNGTNAAVFDMHHLDRSTKLLNLNMVAMINISWKKIQDEVAKCQLLCSNCHRVLHSGGW